jgi:hypothetical protein
MELTFAEVQAIKIDFLRDYIHGNKKLNSVIDQTMERYNVGYQTAKYIGTSMTIEDMVQLQPKISNQKRQTND